MVIFHCDHYGAFTQLLTLRYSKHPDETAVLICGNHGERTEVLKRVEENKLFDQVISFIPEKASKINDCEKIIETLEDYFDNIFFQAGIDLRSTNNIYSSTDTEGAFSLYLNIKNIEYTLIETSKGQLFDEHRYQILLEMGTGSEEYVSLQKKYRVLTYDCKLVKKSILYPETEAEIPSNNCLSKEFFDFNSEFKMLPNVVKQKLLNCYEVDIELFKKPHCLLLPNSAGFTWQCGLPREEYPLVYQLLVDYYQQSHKDITLLIKPHPYGFINFADNFENSVLIDRSFPIELINLYPKLKINETITVHTTATLKIENHIITKTIAGQFFFKAFRYIHKIYTTFLLAKQLINENTKFHQCVENRDFLQSFLQQVFPELNRDFLGINPNILMGDIFTVVDSCNYGQEFNICNGLRDASKNAITVFLNTKNDFCFYDAAHLGLLKDMVPIRIKKQKLRENIFENLNEEYIYCFSKNPEYIEKIRKFTFRKKLPYTGIEIIVDPLEDIEIDKIKLEIRLNATEKAVSDLLHWQDNIRKL